MYSSINSESIAEMGFYKIFIFRSDLSQVSGKCGFSCSQSDKFRIEWKIFPVFESYVKGYWFLLLRLVFLNIRSYNLKFCFLNKNNSVNYYLIKSNILIDSVLIFFFQVNHILVTLMINYKLNKNVSNIYNYSRCVFIILTEHKYLKGWETLP